MTERYEVPEMPYPEGASEGLKHFIEWGRSAIQSLVEVLGSGDTSVPDYAKKLEGDGKVVDIDEKTGSVMVKDYDALKKTVDSAKEAIHVSDRGVDTSAFATSKIVSNAFGDIKDYVDELRRALKNAPEPIRPKPTKENPHPAPYLSADANASLMSAVSKAVDKTHDEVVDAHDKIEQQAHKIGGSAPSYKGSGAPTTTGYSGPSYNGSGPGSADYSSYAGSAANAEPITSGQKAKAEEIYHYLRDKYGLTHNEAVAILGNMQIESSFLVDAKNSAENAIGLIQWEGGRDDALKAYAGNKRDSWKDWKKQVDFMMHEMHTSESSAYAKFRAAAARSPSAGAEAFDRYYERSAGTSRQKRMDAAEAFADSIPDRTSVSA
ncbi:phage tail tip lysozyme [Nocardia beijingensis]|uniref:phage tail tip lysozyme n=1 Tax=Nocardia beijingensis TaxID=95162 RepID=UPI00344CB5F4